MAVKKRIFAFVTALIMSCIFFGLTANAEGGLFSDASGNGELTDGIYIISNKSSGLNLDVYDFSYDSEGKAILAKKSGKDGQQFLIKRQDNGQYVIYPQSENGLYCLSYFSDIMDGEYVFKTSAVTNQSVFSINQNKDGFFTIKPAGMSDSKLALGEMAQKNKKGTCTAGILLDGIDDRTLWEFEKISSEYIKINGGYADIKVGTSKEISAKLYPEYLVGTLSWESSDEYVATVDAFGNVTGVSEGYALITVSCGGTFASTTIRVSEQPAYTWYSQHNLYSGGWFAEPVGNLKINNRTFMINGFNKNIDWMDEGCHICSYAMVLHNLGAELSVGYDLRTEAVNNLPADPYTAVLANTGSDGYGVDSFTAQNTPNSVAFNILGPRFRVNGKSIEKKQKYNVSIDYIKEQLETHPEGVIVEMAISARELHHYIVFTKCINPDAEDGKYEFLVCDSAATNASDGDNVLFTESASYKSIGYRYASIVSVTTLNVIE